MSLTKSESHFGGNPMSRNEVRETLHRYGLYDGNGITTFTESEEIACLVKFFSSSTIIPFELPDSYVKIYNDLLIIEHFAIDGYDEYPGGGSKLRQGEVVISKEFSARPCTSDGVHLSRQLGVCNSYNGFMENCKRRFDQHYLQIDSYKEHLKERGIANEQTRFTVCFLMDEVSPLGTLTHDGENIRPVCLAQAREFLDFFSERPKVDWVISAVVTDEGYKPYFFSQGEVGVCQKNALDYSNYQFLSSNPMSTSYKITIQNIKKVID